MKIKFKFSQQVYQSQLLDKTAGISVEEQTVTSETSNASETVVIASIITFGVVAVVLIGVITYMCTRDQIKKAPVPQSARMNKSTDQLNPTVNQSSHRLYNTEVQLQDSQFATNALELSVCDYKGNEDNLQQHQMEENTEDKKEHPVNYV